MIPTIREAIENALEALNDAGINPGDPVYDDLEQVLSDLAEGLDLDDQLTA